MFENAPDAPPGWLPSWLRPRSAETEVAREPEEFVETRRRRTRVCPSAAVAADVPVRRLVLPTGDDFAAQTVSGSLVRLPTQATLLPRNDRGRNDHRR